MFSIQSQTETLEYGVKSMAPRGSLEESNFKLGELETEPDHTGRIRSPVNNMGIPQIGIKDLLLGQPKDGDTRLLSPLGSMQGAD